MVTEQSFHDLGEIQLAGAGLGRVQSAGEELDALSGAVAWSGGGKATQDSSGGFERQPALWSGGVYGRSLSHISATSWLQKRAVFGPAHSENQRPRLAPRGRWAKIMR